MIATFTVPKVLHSIDEASYRTALKQAESVIQSVTHDAYMEGYTGNRSSYFHKRLNFIKYCTNGVTQGCMVVPDGETDDEYTERAFVLPSGVTIGGIQNVNFNHANGDGWRIDLNGVKPPNSEGVDIIYWQAPRYNTYGQILNCSGRKLGCPSTSVLSITRYNELMGLP